MLALLFPLALALSQQLADPAPSARNVLVIVADDVGCDMLSCYAGAAAPPTPHLDALAARGVRFTRAYANPWCSPTRAALLTGRYGFRTGIGSPINSVSDQVALADDELTLPEVLARGLGEGFDSSAIGKWHLSRLDDLDAPRRQGFRWYEGVPANLEGQADHTLAREVRNGELVECGRYALTEETDDALARAHAMREPWLLYTAYHAVHEPLHMPPVALGGDAPVEGREPTRPEMFRAMVRALDREVGRLLAGLGPELLARTDVLFLGDNGTFGEVLEDKRLRIRSKGTLFEGGVRVPLLCAGPSVAQPGRTSAELVGIVDLFATACDLFGVNARSHVPAEVELDSRSLLALLRDPTARSGRASVLCEEFRPNGHGPFKEVHRAIVGVDGKLCRDPGGLDRYFDLTDPVLVDRPLKLGQLTPAQRLRFDELSRVYDALLGGK